MINHMRTLLINERRSDVLPVSTIYVPTNFTPVSVPAQFSPLHDILYPVGLTLAERVALADNIVTVLHTGEVERYTLRFDTRVTYRDVPDKQLIDLCRTTSPNATSLTALTKRLTTTAAVGTAGTLLFNWPRFSDDLRDLSYLWNNKIEGCLRTSAFVLAYLYQLERVRIGGV